MTAAIERNAPPPHFQIEEDSVVWKALSCVPLLGWIPAFIQFSSLSNKDKEIWFKRKEIGFLSSLDISQKIELLEVKNDYIKAYVVSGLLSIAIAVSWLYLGIFIRIGACLLVYGVTSIISSCLIYATKERFKELQSMMVRQEDRERFWEYAARRGEDLEREIENLGRLEEDLLIQREDLLIQIRHAEDLLMQPADVVN